MKRTIEQIEREYESLRAAREQAPSDIHAWCVAEGAQLEVALAFVERDGKGVVCASVSRVELDSAAQSQPELTEPALSAADAAQVETPRTSEP